MIVGVVVGFITAVNTETQPSDCDCCNRRCVIDHFCNIGPVSKSNQVALGWA